MVLLRYRSHAHHGETVQCPNSAFGLDVIGCIRLHEAARQSLAVREERDTALKPEASSADCRVLALLPDASANADLARLDLTRCTGIDDLESHLAQGSFEVVIVDTSLADDWPVDVAADLATRADRPFALLLLFEQSNDRLVAEHQINARDVWFINKNTLDPSELAIITAGLASLYQRPWPDLTKN